MDSIKKEFQQFVEALDESTQEKIDLIYAESDLTKYGYGESYSSLLELGYNSFHFSNHKK